VKKMEATFGDKNKQSANCHVRERSSAWAYRHEAEGISYQWVQWSQLQGPWRRR